MLEYLGISNLQFSSFSLYFSFFCSIFCFLFIFLYIFGGSRPFCFHYFGGAWIFKNLKYTIHLFFISLHPSPLSSRSSYSFTFPSHRLVYRLVYHFSRDQSNPHTATHTSIIHISHSQLSLHTHSHYLSTSDFRVAINTIFSFTFTHKI